jgi:hypothetical protein
MRQAMRGSESEGDKFTWTRLASTLHIDPTTIDEIRKQAAYPRHGRPWAMSDEDRARVFKLTDEIIARYLEFLVHGAPLSIEKFPVLKP